MKHALVTLTVSVGVALLTATVYHVRAQDMPVTDAHVWLRQQQPQPPVTDDPRSVAQQAIRDQIATVRGRRAATVMLSRAGEWRSTVQPNARQRLIFQVQQNTNDGTVGGRVIVSGSSRFSDANISGRVTSGRVSGAVTDGSGFQLATFTGAASATGMSGRYETFDGDRGTWSYDDPAPVASEAP